MKTSPISISEHLSSTLLQQPVAPLLQKKAQVTKPRLKNFFEMAKDVETERKHRRVTKKAQEPLLPSSIEIALLEKTLIHQDSVSSRTSIAFEPLGSTALVQAILEKVSYQIEKGIEKTSIFFGESPKNPSLKGSEILITCYDTDPMRFHLEFFSSAQGILVLNSEMSNLKEQLQKKFPDQFFSLAKPCLNTYPNKNRPDYFIKKIR